jgi:HEAT repeat protein
LIAPGYGVVEITSAGKAIWEALLPGGVNNFCLALGLARLGFDSPRPTDLNLATSIPYRIKGLANKNALIRFHSARALQAFGPKAEVAIPQLIRALDDPDILVRETMCSALEAIGPPALQPLIEATNDSRLHIRSLAVRALHVFKNQSKVVVPVLIKSLRDNDVSVRREAAIALSHFAPQSPEMIPALIEVLKDKDEAKSLQETSVPQAAVQILRAFGPKAKIAIPALIEALNTHDVYFRGYVIVALGEIGPEAKGAVPAILKVLDTNGVANSNEALHIRSCVTFTLAQIGGPEAASAVPTLIEVLENKESNPVDRRRAAKALGRIGSTAVKAVPALKRSLNDNDDALRVEAAQALKAIDN